MEKTYILIKYSKGVDSGFGDYCPPDWSCAPTLKDKDGKVVWFSDSGTARKFVELCNEKSTNHFYSLAKSEPYDGNFPVEYAMFSVEIPDHKSYDDAELAFSAVEKHVEEYALTNPYYFED